MKRDLIWQRIVIALLIGSVVFAGQAWAGAKTVNGLAFQLSPPPKEHCLFQPFHVWHERDAFFKGLKQVKTKPTTQYRRGHDVVENYPDSTTVRVELGQGLPEFNSCIVLPKFDPAKLQFRVEWQIGSQVAPAKGTFVVAERSSPQPWCENRCTDYWAYELRIDSQNVPLQSELLLTIETKDGTRLAKYLGKLSTAQPLNIQ
jgi:hypothetical protein